MSLPSFPPAQQAQIIRANQRDLYHVSSLRDQTENVLRSWLGTRWLTRWDREVALLVKLVYYGATTGRAMQTLGEEYTDIWQSSIHTPPSSRTRAGLILLPTLSAYALGRFGNLHPFRGRFVRFAKVLKVLPIFLEIVSEVNLAIFYLRGVYYDVVKRIFGIRYLSSIPEDPLTRAPSYSLLGILIIIRLLHRLVTAVREQAWLANASDKGKGKATPVSRETYLDERPVSSFLELENLEEPARPAEEDRKEQTAVQLNVVICSVGAVSLDGVEKSLNAPSADSL